MSYNRDGQPLKQELPEQAPVEVAADAQETSVDQSTEQEEQTSAAQEENLQQPTQHSESVPEKNWRAIREKALLMEKERNDMALKLQQYELERSRAQQSYAQNQHNPQTDDHDEDVVFPEEDLLEGKHLNKAVKSLQKQIRDQKEQLRIQQQQSIELAAEARVKAQYPDFDSIVTTENLRLLQMSDPEIAATIATSTGDLYTRSVTAYRIIKNMGLYENKAFDADKVLAQKNAAKPRPLTSIAPQQGDSPLSRANAFANGLTPELKKQLHKEMVESMKKV